MLDIGKFKYCSQIFYGNVINLKWYQYFYKERFIMETIIEYYSLFCA